MSRHILYFITVTMAGWLCLLAATPSRAGELTNPGFETGDLSGWTGWPTPALTTVETTSAAHGGAKVARLGFNGAVNTIIQDIASPASQLTPNGFYTFTVWYQYRTDLTTDTPAITVHYENAQGKLVGNYNTASGLPGSTSAWRSMQLAFQAFDAPLLRISLRGGMSEKAHGVAWFDDAALAKVNGAPDKLDIYLLMGQSNMVGMEKSYLPEETTPHPRIFMLNASNKWVPAVEPVHGVGVGPGLTFAKAMAEHSPNARIGLVPMAVGSTPIGDWVKGAIYYDQTVLKAQVACQQGTLKGILWHQGESDSYDPELADVYAGQIQGMVADLRVDLAKPGLPFVCGELGRFLGSAYRDKVSAALLDLPRQVPNVAAVSSEGLTNLDPWHFNAASQRVFGQRYAEAMIALQERPACALAWQCYNGRQN